MRRSYERKTGIREVDDTQGLPPTLTALAQALCEGSLSPVGVVEALLGRIEERNGELNAFVTVTAEEALEDARRAEAEIRAGRYRGPLHGVPIGLKDLIETRGVRTTMGSAFFADYFPAADAAVVELLKDAGAVVLGKTNTHEFAFGPIGDRSFSGPARNPHDLDRVPGGSSGGSGAAVAAGLVYGALGTDSGGSIRVPAALCGAVGMKPTFGRVSKRGVFPLSWVLDHVGPLSRTVEDNALLLTALACYDSEDPYSVDIGPEDFARDLTRGAEGGVVGVPADFYFEHIDPEIEELVRATIRRFEDLGAETREVEIPGLQETLSAQRLVLASEAHAVHRERLDRAPEKFDDEVRQRLLEGAEPRAYEYAEAQQERLRSIRAFRKALEDVYVILTPTVPIAATEIGQRKVDINGYEETVRSALTRFTGPTNLNGLPSLSVPCGRTASGLPVGIQVIGRPFDEATLYRYGHALEGASS